MIPPIEETFAGNVWRVQAVEGGFAVLGSAPTSFGVEVEICRVAYLPHALAIAALPEMAQAIKEAETDFTMFGEMTLPNLRDYLRPLEKAINKAEGRHLFNEKD